MSYKKRAIQYGKRDGKPRVEYWVVDDEGCIKTASPRAWHHLDLEDQTTDKTLETAAQMRYKATRTQFRDQVDDNALLRQYTGPDSARYQWLCNLLDITY